MKAEKIEIMFSTGLLQPGEKKTIRVPFGLKFADMDYICGFDNRAVENVITLGPDITSVTKSLDGVEVEFIGSIAPIDGQFVCRAWGAVQA